GPRLAGQCRPVHADHCLTFAGALLFTLKIIEAANLVAWSLEMNRHEGKTFENQHLILDEGVFINCVFKNCSLEYSGGDVYVQNCQGEGCQLVWRGAAQRTVFLLQGLGLMAAPTAQPTQTLERTNRVQ